SLVVRSLNTDDLELVCLLLSARSGALDQQQRCEYYGDSDDNRFCFSYHQEDSLLKIAYEIRDAFRQPVEVAVEKMIRALDNAEPLRFVEPLDKRLEV